MDQITIAAWNGAAMGGGAVLATAMDLRIGADDCFMQYPEIDIGVNLMWKGLPLVTHIAGPSRAKRLVIGGERIHAPQLYEWGILDDLVPQAELMDTAREWASRYAAKSPIPAQMIKRSVNTLVSALDVAVMHMDVDQNLLSGMTEDRRAAIEAYRSGAEPKFTEKAARRGRHSWRRRVDLLRRCRPRQRRCLPTDHSQSAGAWSIPDFLLELGHVRLGPAQANPPPRSGDLDHGAARRVSLLSAIRQW